MQYKKLIQPLLISVTGSLRLQHIFMYNLPLYKILHMAGCLLCGISMCLLFLYFVPYQWPVSSLDCIS